MYDELKERCRSHHHPGKQGGRGMKMNELDKLRGMLTEANIPFESYQEKHPALLSDNAFWKNNFTICAELYGECGIYGRNQIIYGRSGENSWKIDGICQYGSYGADVGLIETYGELGADEDGNPRVLNAEQVFEIIKEDFCNQTQHRTGRGIPAEEGEA